MNEVSVEHEPPPPPKPGPRISGGAHIQIVDSKTGEITQEVYTPHYYENAKRLRREQKY